MMSELIDTLTDRQLVERVNRMKIYDDDEKLRLFTFFSANILHYLPNIPVHKHEDAFKQICLHQHLSWRDQYDLQLEERVSIAGWDGAFVEELKEEPGIICTFHSGSYRLINRMLASSGVPFTLVVNKEVLRREAANFQQGFEKVNISAQQRLNIIDAEDSSALFKMIRALKSGHNILVYVDGNTGMGKNSDNLVSVDFMASQLSVRKGVVVLANLLKCPLYPVTCIRTSLENIQFKAFTKIQPDQLDVDADSKEVYGMQRLYAHLESSIDLYPFQWECWLYASQYINENNVDNQLIPGSKEDLFDAASWGVFKVNGDRFILDKRSFTSYRIPISIYDEVIRNSRLRM